ncbi:MAG TPA: beta-ketoacyl synthase N-terminal-like domain-containing protein [Thermoanaerobaculia bacterium]|nr:beta-ketoacyl synthase N-terminal-like domain-containing protein [Thermoanaerobaculia bacterium]
MSQDEAPQHGIAVVGVAGRFPAARSVAQLWENLRAGVESITFFSDEELLAAGVDPALLRHEQYVKAKGVLDDVELFDAGFFGFTPREAELLDPQHRFLLECAWEALEDAGYDPERYAGRIAVYAGSGTSYYLLANLLPDSARMERLGTFQTMLLNDRDFLATRLSYKLNLKGPSVLVQTACSTGLVAAHMACQGLLAGEADLALAGGVSISLPVVEGYLYQEGGVSSPDGHCRAFDAKAGGSVGGSGAVILALKRLADALADGDSIYAVIRGSAVNNDGSGKVGFTAPSIEGQAEVITEALMMADVAPESIGFVEGHGSGTALGDPIEVSALIQAFRDAGAEGTGYCALGSIKTNVGHLNTAAGAAGLLKAVLAVRDGVIPASLHFEQPNLQVDFASSPFYVPAATVPWPEGFEVRRAGVSSFGLGGTNAHAIVEQPPVPEPSGSSRPWQLLTLSARSDAALDAATARLAGRLESSDLELADVAFTLQTGRKAFGRRRALVCRDREDAVTALRALDPSRVIAGGHEGRERPVAFLFPGLGDHYPGMMRELYETEPTFAEEVDRCADLLRLPLGVDVREVLFPPVSEAEAAGPGRQTDLRALLRRGPVDEASQRLARTEVAQPAMFVVEYALARLLMEWGIKPQAMIGYSLGEYVAACLAGVLTLEDALTLVARRARLIQELPEGSMLAVPLPEEEVRPLLTLLDKGLSLSATNGPHFCVVGGTDEAVADLDQRLADRGVSCLRLTTTHAFHSQMMEPAVAPLSSLARSLPLQAPAIRYVSNVTGTWITAADLADPGYWARHMTQPVRFAEGLAELLREPDLVLLEVGPGSTLSTLVRQHPEGNGRTAVSTVRRESERGSDVALLLEAAGRLWTAGVSLDTEGFFAHEKRRRVPLPTYPFERQRCWVDPPARTGGPQPARRPLDAGPAPDLADWFYVPGWRRAAPLVRTAPPDVGPWLVFADRAGRVAEALRREGARVVEVVPGESFDPTDREAYSALVARLKEEDALPRRVLHLWTVENPGEPGLLSLLFLAQAMGEAGVNDPLQVTVVSSRLLQVVDGEPVDPDKAMLLAALKVLPQEYPHWTCRGVDVTSLDPERLLAEAAASDAPLVAWRGRDRWARTFEPVRIEKPAATPLRREGVYLVTDGLHGVGPALARQLLNDCQARIALIVPPGSPRPEDWDDLESAGEVWVVTADLTDRESLSAALAGARRRFGALHGVFHTAASAAGGLVQLKTAATLAADLAPQVEGARLLQSLLADEPVDFLLLCSSTLAATGGFGQLEIAAAGAVLDALAAGSDGAPFTVAVHWDPYQWDGWLAAGVGGAPLLSAEDLEKNLSSYGVPSARSAEALQRLLAAGTPRVVVSAHDLDALIRQADQITAATLMAQMEQSRRAAPAHARQFATPYVAPRTDLETEIAAAWQDLFGIAEIGIHDNFLELGGHSLLAIQVTTELRKRYEVDLPVTAVFETPTIAELAESITRARQSAEADLEDLLAAVEGLSPEEALKRMEEEMNSLA